MHSVSSGWWRLNNMKYAKKRQHPSSVATSMMDAMSRREHWLSVVTVITVLLHGTHGQSYHFTIGPHPRNFDLLYRDLNIGPLVTEANFTESSSDLDGKSTNSTIIVVQSSARDTSNELSQTAMDIITIVWYVATFLALAAFFLLMACSDRRCGDVRRNNTSNANESPIQPPTPSPSYSEFAPPSYDSVMKIQQASKTSVFVIHYPDDQPPKDGNTIPQADTPTINVYTINELQKLGC